MAFHTLIALINMFSMQFLTTAATPGLQAVAVVTQITLHLDKARWFFGMTAGARQFHLAAVAGRMLVVHGLPCRGLCGVTQGTVGDLGRPGLIPQFAEGDHLGAVNGLTGAGVALGTGRGLGLWINTVGDQHLGIDVHRGVAAGEALVCHAGQYGPVEIAGHEHVHDHRWNDLAALVQRHDRPVIFDRHDLGFAVEGLAVGLGHGVGAVGIFGDYFTNIVNVRGAVEPAILRFDVGDLDLFTDVTALAGAEGRVPDGFQPVAGHLGGAALGEGADMAGLAGDLALGMTVQHGTVMGRGCMAGGAFRISRFALTQINATAADLVICRYMAGGTGHVLTAGIGRHMNVFGDRGVFGAQAHVAAFGPVSAAGLGMAAQTGSPGRFVNVLGQRLHGGSRWHQRVIRHRCVVAKRVLGTKKVCLYFPIDIGDGCRIGRIGNRLALVGVAMAHEAVHVIDIRWMRGITVGAHMTGIAGALGRRGVGAEGVDTANRLAKYLARGIS